MAAHERSLTTTADPSAVWRIWSDTSTWPEWNPDIRSVQLDGPFSTGTTGTMTTNAGSHAIRLANVVEGQTFTVETSPIPLTTFHFRCEIRPGSSGGCTISQSLAMSGPLGPIFSPLMGGRIADSFPALLRGLAAAAEASPTR